MKKFISISILLILFTIAAIVPGKLREMAADYEQRLVAVVNVVEQSLISAASDDYLDISIYAPKLALQGDSELLVVTGIAGLSTPGGSEVFENFAADVQNTCESVSDSDCLRIAALTFGDSKVVEAGALVGRIQGLPLPTKEDGTSGDSIVEPVPIGQPVEGRTEVVPSATESEAGQDQSDPAEWGPSDPQHNISPDDRVSSDVQVIEIQRALKKLGYDPGPADNFIGPRTLSAILAYQRRQGLEPNGQPSRYLLEHIMSSQSDDSE